MWSHKIKKFFCLIVITLFLNCSDQGTIHINGDHSNVGSKVYIDNDFKGIMKKLKNGSMITIKVQNGSRKIVVVQRDSVIYEEKITLKGETYIGLE